MSALQVRKPTLNRKLTSRWNRGSGNCSVSSAGPASFLSTAIRQNKLDTKSEHRSRARRLGRTKIETTRTFFFSRLKFTPKTPNDKHSNFHLFVILLITTQHFMLKKDYHRSIYKFLFFLNISRFQVRSRSRGQPGKERSSQGVRAGPSF